MKIIRMGVILSFALLAGCAGSAQHEVLTANQAGDDRLDCDRLDSEIVKAQVVIDGVKKDKSDVSGKDVVDGILWFPFNLIAKNSNYKSSLEAADRRIDRLYVLKKERGCRDTTAAVNKKTDSVLEQIKELNALYKNGAVTKEEYVSAKQKLLDKL